MDGNYVLSYDQFNNEDLFRKADDREAIQWLFFADGRWLIGDTEAKTAWNELGGNALEEKDDGDTAETRQRARDSVLFRSSRDATIHKELARSQWINQSETQDISIAKIFAGATHVTAPGGAGKTFFGIHCVLLTLDSGTGVVVWAVRNESLGTSVAKWILRRLRGDQLDEMQNDLVEADICTSLLSKLFLVCEPFEAGLRRITVQDDKLQLVPADALSMGKVALFVVDEAHHVHESGKLQMVVDQYRMEAPLIFLSDVSQSKLGNEIKNTFEATEVKLTEVVRCSQVVG